MAERQAPQPRQVSRNALANEIIELLRQAAEKITLLGDDLVEVRAELASMEEEFALSKDDSEELESWRELLEDFRRGVRDADELFAGTIEAVGV